MKLIKNRIDPPLAKVARDDVAFFVQHVKLNENFLKFREKEDLKNTSFDRLMVMNLYRRLLQIYYAIERCNKPIQENDIVGSETYIADRKFELEKPTFRELVARYLKISESKDSKTMELLIERLESHKLFAEQYKSCMICYNYLPVNEFTVMVCGYINGHMACTKCVETLDNNAWKSGRQRRDSGLFDCPGCNRKVHDTINCYFI